MMKLRTYAGFSLVGAITIIYHAFSSRGQFYPATVYLSTSKISLVVLMNMGLVIMCTLWQLTKFLFLGSLREVEVERLNEQSWREVMEIIFTLTIFRQDFSVTFLAMVTALLLIKAWHWMVQKRVEYIETTPSVTTLSHVRIVSFMVFLLALDCLIFFGSFKYLIQTWRPSVALFFAFEYMILATTTLSTFVKYVFYVCDMLMEGQWERKAVYTFYLELVRDLLHLSMYLCFFLLIFVYYGLPLNLIREIYETFRNFKVRVADYIRYRKITSNMNERFPDATSEELDAGDATCIICREEMIKAKKLLCGHLFHVHCLRSWLERQHTCPTCRALVVPSENGLAPTGGQHGVQPEIRPHGSGVTGTSAQSSEGNAVDNDMSQHQARLQAAAAAASVYEKSFIYPPANTFLWTPAYALLPQTGMLAFHGENTDPTIETTTSGQLQEHGDKSNPKILNMLGSQLQAQERFLRHQIEFHQSQLQLLQQQTVEESKVAVAGGASPAMPDGKGKTAAAGAASASVSDCGRHGEIEEANTN